MALVRSRTTNEKMLGIDHIPLIIVIFVNIFCCYSYYSCSSNFDKFVIKIVFATRAFLRNGDFTFVSTIRALMDTRLTAEIYAHHHSSSNNSEFCFFAQVSNVVAFWHKRVKNK